MTFERPDATILLLRRSDPAEARCEQLAARMASREAIRDRAVRLGGPERPTRDRALVAKARPRRLSRGRIAIAAMLGAAVVVATLSLLPSPPSDYSFEEPRPVGDPTERTFANTFAALMAASGAAAGEASESAGATGAQGAAGPYPYVHLLEQDSTAEGGYVGTVSTDSEIWFRKDGSTHVRFATSGPQFPSPRDERLWQAAGSPALGAPASEGEEDRAPRFSIGQADHLGAYLLKPAKQRLPRNPEELARVFASVTADSTSAGAGDDSPDGDSVQTFDYASRILLDVAYDEKLRAAAYEVVANLDGVRLDGRVRDPIGRLGTSVSFEAAVDRGPLTRYSLIFDTDTSEPLASTRELVNAKGASGSPAIDYEALLAAGRTDAIGERP